MRNKTKNIRDKITLFLEGIGIGTTLSGIAYEAAAGHGVGYLLISLGSLLVALGAVIWKKLK